MLVNVFHLALLDMYGLKRMLIIIQEHALPVMMRLVMFVLMQTLDPALHVRLQLFLLLQLLGHAQLVMLVVQHVKLIMQLEIV